MPTFGELMTHSKPDALTVKELDELLLVAEAGKRHDTQCLLSHRELIPLIAAAREADVLRRAIRAMLRRDSLTEAIAREYLSPEAIEAIYGTPKSEPLEEQDEDSFCTKHLRERPCPVLGCEKETPAPAQSAAPGQGEERCPFCEELYEDVRSCGCGGKPSTPSPSPAPNSVTFPPEMLPSPDEGDEAEVLVENNDGSFRKVWPPAPKSEGLVAELETIAKAIDREGEGRAALSIRKAALALEQAERLEMFNRNLLTVLSTNYDKAQATIASLRAALEDLVSDCEDYSRINNLHNADGSPATNHAMRRARTALAALGVP